MYEQSNIYTGPYDFVPGQVTWLSTHLQIPSPIAFGHRISDQFTTALQESAGDRPIDRVFVITDQTLHELYAREFIDMIAATWSSCRTRVLPVGESAKTFTHLQQLCDWLISEGATKSSVVIALGGGAVGNIAGLAAALIYRGIRFVEVPTSFTHQTDGTLSNKQAINGERGKNQFGVYHSPILIWTDTRYLLSEPANLKNAGIVETIKNSLIDQPALVEYLRTALRRDCDYDAAQITELAHKTILSKLEILKQDPSEKAYGIVLEYGHTFGHAIEWLAEGRLIHGESVAVGMKIAAHLAHQLGWIDAGLVDLHYELIDQKMGLLPVLPAGIDSASILRAMQVDNKKTGARVRYVLLDRLGACRNSTGDYMEAIDDEIVLSILDRVLASYPERPALATPAAP